MDYYEEKQILRNYFLMGFPRKWLQPEESEIIMVLASGKCGTTTVTHLLNCSKDIVAYHEMIPKLWHLGDRVYRDNCESELWEEIYWSAKRDIISISAENDFIFGESNHRISYFAPAVKSIIPKAKFLVVWRDFDETVISGCRWGIYSKYDANIEGRLTPPKELIDIRKQVAWYWIATYSYILNFAEDCENIVTMPFELIENKDIAKIQEVFEKLEVDIPDKKLISSVLEKKYNKSTNNQPVPKIWHDFDREAQTITERLRGL